MSTPEADRWLAHYVRMGFYYVAMRYDPPRSKDDKAADVGRVKAETMRISFATPLPYYPYFEPEPPKASPQSGGPRMLEVWLVTNRLSVPLAAQKRSGKLRWVKPLAEGQRYPRASRSALNAALGKEAQLLFEGELIVQRFMDQKRSRVGFGDVLFVPAAKKVLDAKALSPLLAILDPSLAARQAKEAAQ